MTSRPTVPWVSAAGQILLTNPIDTLPSHRGGVRGWLLSLLSLLSLLGDGTAATTGGWPNGRMAAYPQLLLSSSPVATKTTAVVSMYTCVQSPTQMERRSCENTKKKNGVVRREERATGPSRTMHSPVRC